MVEGGAKPKKEGERKFNPRYRRASKQSSSSANKQFKAPTSGIETYVFKQGDASDAANFDETKKAIAKWAAVHFKHGASLAHTAIDRLEVPTFTEPADPPAPTAAPTPAETKATARWKFEYDAWLKDQQTWDEVRPRAFQLVMSHVHPDLEAKLERSGSWANIVADQDIVELLKLIRGYVHQHDEVKQGTMALVEHDLDLKLNFQEKGESLDKYYKAFKARIEIINTFGGQQGYHPVVYKKHREEKAVSLGHTTDQIDLLTDEQNEECMKSSCEEYNACLFIRLANATNYGELKTKLDNMWLFDRAAYPTTLERAYVLCDNFQSERVQTKHPKERAGQDGVSFVQPGNKELGPCNGCGEMGHLVRRCPKLTNAERTAVLKAMRDGTHEGQNHANVGGSAEDTANEELQECLDGVEQVNIGFEEASIATLEEEDYIDGVGFIQPGTAGVPSKNVRVECGRNKLFLDTCATNNTMYAVEHLERRHSTKVYLRQNCNAGSKLTNKCGYYLGMRFYENAGGIANLLSAPALEKAGWKIEFKTGGPIRAMSPEGLVLTFKRDTGLTGGMPYIDMSRPKEFISHVIPTESIACVETVRENMKGLSLEQITKAKAARDALAMMAHPSEDKIKYLVSHNNVVNIPFTSTDFANGRVVFGRDRGALRGKTVRKKAQRVRPELITIPQQLYERLRDVILTADVMFLNGLPFFVTLSRNIKLITVEYLPSRTAKQYHESLKKVSRLYRRGGYLIKVALMDMAFKALEDSSVDVLVNTTAAREHVHDIERCIQTIKNGCRSTLSEVPYKHCMPDVFIVYLIKFVVMWLNAFPASNGVSDEFSPREIITGLRLDFNKHCRARWGSYVEASQDADVTNTMADRTAPCIVLGPTGNVQGSVSCYNLQTKQVVTRRTITPLPMPDRVIKRVLQLGEETKQVRVSKRIQFLNRIKQQFDWGDGTEDDDEGLVESDPHETDAIPAEIPGVELERDFDRDDEPVAQEAPLTDLQRARAALHNANLPSATAREIAGVDDLNHPPPAPPAPAVTDDEGDDDMGSDDDDTSEIEFIQNADEVDLTAEDNADGIDLTAEDNDQPAAEGESEEQIDDDSLNGTDVDQNQEERGDSASRGLAEFLGRHGQQLGMAEEEDSTGAVRRRSRRQKKQKKPMEIDFENRAYRVDDGVLHINQNVLEQVREDAKITSGIVSELKADCGMDKPKLAKAGDASRMALKSPAKAGVTRQALQRVCLGGLGLPPPGLKEGEAVVEDHVMMHVLGVVLAEQYSINKGIRLFGERAKESITKELRQLHDYVTYRPVHAHELTPEEKKQALASLIFLTEKRCGRIKTRACVNGSTQRDYIPKESTASPTVMTDSVMIQSAIDAHEGRIVVTCDIPGAFLHADLDEEVVMLLRGQLADLMVAVDPALYGPYLRKTKKGESILYVKMLKAMYGLLRSALLFYLKLVRDLTDYGFELNPYDPCVANKVVNGKQMTVMWHVDDLKISHVEKEVIDEFLTYLKSKYGENLVVHEGNVHDYLGVDHDYGEKGVVKLSMMKHLEKILKDFPEEIERSSSTPASENLFKIRDPEECDRQNKWLSKDKAEAFHHSVAQLLFVCMRVRRDIQTAVAFLTTRVRKPDEDDWGKLKRILKYLKGTFHMKLRLSVSNLGVIRWWVDASYNVHEDCRGQTGAMMSLGRGAAISFSRKQKLNVRSSCEGELVGIDDALPLILWARYFIEAQGYTVEENILFQDNKSTILLANNGRWSSSKRTKHIKSRYFFIKDKVDSGEVSIEYKPTKQMWCDTLTKPKQGAAFRQDRAMLMDCDVDYDDNKEMKITPAVLLPKSDGPVDPKTVTSILKPGGAPTKDRRSVLDGGGKRMVTWNTSQGKADANNAKVRERHLEVMIARVMRKGRAREAAAAA